MTADTNLIETPMNFAIGSINIHKLVRIQQGETHIREGPRPRITIAWLEIGHKIGVGVQLLIKAECLPRVLLDRLATNRERWFEFRNDGFYPRGGVILSGNTLYGTTSGGGSAGIYGTLFRVNTDGTGFTNLHSFTATSGGLGSGTNIDGTNPEGGLVISGNTLYGTALYGGSSGDGAVFAIQTDGTGFTNLHSFAGNSDGKHPLAGLILSSNNRLYGTTYQGGSVDNGTVFALNTDGTGFTNLHNFTAVSTTFPYDANSDGANPQAGLAFSCSTLYGTTTIGGSSRNGTVFSLNTDGTGFTNLYSFTGGEDGLYPVGGVIVSGNILYGTAAAGGGSSVFGTVFRISLESDNAPQLTIIRSGENVILTWQTNAPGFILQSTTDLVPTEAWTTVSPPPVIANGQNTVTNSASERWKFYRLSQ